MPIRAETEIQHQVLGTLRFDDGAAVPELGRRSEPSQWVARPDGDQGRCEYYLAGGRGGPERSSLAVAMRVSCLLDQTEQHAPQSSGSVLELAWVDCTAEAPTVGLLDPSDAYLLWEGTLDDNLHLTNLTTRYC